MTTKDRVLEALILKEGEYISGQQLARELGISRNAVWKAVNALTREGYSVDAVSNKGYRITGGDLLTLAGISAFLSDEARAFYSLDVRESVSSTSSLLREEALSFSGEGLIIAASQQSAGRGRLGRSFISPRGSGAYFSIMLRPDTAIEDTVFITTAAAVALCLAIKDTFGIATEIKWVNDIYLNGKKICGILTEGILDLNCQRVDSVILGIGINIYEPEGGFDGEISKVAGALLDKRIPFASCKTVGAFLSRFLEIYKAGDKAEIARLYREFNMTVGRRITVISGGVQRPAVALGIDSHCRLEVQYEDSGERALLSSGEISIRQGELAE